MAPDRHAPVRTGGGMRVLSLVLLVALPLLFAGCTTGNPQSTLDPKGPFAQTIFNLFSPVMIAALVVFVVVEALIVYSVWRFRARPGDPLPNQVHGNTPLEITWTIIPAVILLVILGFTFYTQSVLADVPAAGPGGNAINVRVIGHQWWWEFEYPDLAVTTANELHIPVGVPVKLQLESNDVIHSFWVPHLGGKTDVIPGRINHLWFQADEAGTYNGQCAEFCGIEHALMRLQVVAQSPSDFDSWVRGQRAIPNFAPTPTPAAGATTGTPSLVSTGAQLFANGACISCHTVRGTPANGKVGPDLTHVGSRANLVANTLPNTPENLSKWLHNPQAIKPGNDMPNLNLSDQDVEALVAYLESLK
jgi:cytochrome c oxidase subunit 2